MAEIPPTENRLLPIGYYADNFALVLDTVRERYADVLNASETALAETWHGLSLGARRLYVRLISRKGPVLRRDRLGYAEIPDLAGALAELRDAGLADDAPDVPAADLLPLLLRSELRELALAFSDDGFLDAVPSAGARKDDFLDACAEVDDTVLRQAVLGVLTPVRPLGLDVVLVYRLLFFGNLHQDLTEFVLRDLGVVRFEPYPLERELRLFPTREDLEQALALRLCRNEVAVLLWEDELDAAVGLAHGVLEEDWLDSGRRYVDRIANAVGRDLERAGRDGEALTFYEASASPPSRERRARVLERLGRDDEALALCREVEAAPQDETEAEFAPRFIHKLRKKLGEDVPPRKRPRRPTRTLHVEPHDGVPVEMLALEVLAADGRAGFFAENWLWKSLFGLAFWDVVFQPLPGAFQHPFQYGPLDLSTPDFRKNRKEQVRTRLDEIRSGDWSSTVAALLARWDEKRDTANALVAWGDELRPCLELALSVLDGVRLAAVCDRLSRDLRRYRRGLPDLFVVDGDGGFELLEVKGPGDQLRPEQGAWIDVLNASGLPASILKVTFGG